MAAIINPVTDTSQGKVIQYPDQSSALSFYAKPGINKQLNNNSKNKEHETVKTIIKMAVDFVADLFGIERL
jgi:hypothetical protein